MVHKHQASVRAASTITSNSDWHGVACKSRRYTDWYKNEPNNYEDEDCVAIRFSYNRQVKKSVWY